METLVPPAVTADTRIAVVCADFYADIADALYAGAAAVLTAVHVTRHTVPGAFEIPLRCQQLFADEQCDAIVALGAVIRGATSHYDYVCTGLTHGLMRVMLDAGKPIGFGVLTTDTRAQADERARPDSRNKGRETALAVLRMLAQR